MRKLEEIRNNGKIKIYQEVEDGISGVYHDFIHNKEYTLIFSWGDGWEHLSVSSYITPSWEVMCKLKEIFWNDEEMCVEYHPKKSEYVNNHEHCLHIWRPIEEKMPTPPKWMV